MWPEVKQALDEKRHELILSGNVFSIISLTYSFYISSEF